MSTRAPAILDQLASLADSTRDRVLLLLDGHELTVGELCTVMQLPQSTVSRHLKALSDSGWTSVRAEGTSRLYAMARGEANGPAHRLWEIVRGQVGSALAEEDQRRLEGVLAQRRHKSQQFFSSSAGQWDRMRDELFGERFLLPGLAALLPCHWVVGDLGCGTGQVSATLAPFVRRVIAVDASSEMLEAAGQRVQSLANVDLRLGELEALPVPDAALDAATLMLVLHYVPEPGRALADVARTLQPGGHLVLVDMLPHDREAYRQQMGHVWLGFASDHIGQLLRDAGFRDLRILPLPPDARAKGPSLFIATAEKGA